MANVMTVNLDALIPREDFETIANDATSQASGGHLKLSELEPTSITFRSLRKPDFQRETANWTPEKVVSLVRAFLDNELIPSIIMWRSPRSSHAFVIDGAHRLSALIAWIHDDYGDRLRSQEFFNNSITKAQRKAADATRDLIAKEIGSYREIQFAAQQSGTQASLHAKRASSAGFNKIDVQWVQGDASNAEKSFFTINQSSTAIHATELQLLKSRKKANAIAARAIIRQGTGHKYWSGFPTNTQSEIEELARETYEILFEPALDSPIKTLDLPIAGGSYSADSLSLVVDFINLANTPPTPVVPPLNAHKARGKSASASPVVAEPPDDEDGSLTIKYLAKVRRVAMMISGTSASSLGLHPAVYFYSATGRYQPTAFLAAVRLVQQLEATGRLVEFCMHRAQFEAFLINYKHFINQLVKNYGSGMRSLEPIVIMYNLVLQGVQNGHAPKEIAANLQLHEKLKMLKPTGDEDVVGHGAFSRDAKSAAFLRLALEEASLKCGICGARIHSKGISVDHKERKREGGSSHSSNAEILHPYCNSTVKN